MEKHAMNYTDITSILSCFTVPTRVDNKHNCEDEIGRAWLMLNYIYKSQCGQYDAQRNVENGYNKKCPLPQI